MRNNGLNKNEWIRKEIEVTDQEVVKILSEGLKKYIDSTEFYHPGLADAIRYAIARLGGGGNGTQKNADAPAGPVRKVPARRYPDNSKIMIMGIPHTIVFKEDAFIGDTHFGQVEYSKAKITLNADMNEALTEETLTHEVLHAIFVHMGREDLTDDERLVQCLSNAIFQSFKPKVLLPEVVVLQNSAGHYAVCRRNSYGQNDEDNHNCDSDDSATFWRIPANSCGE